MEQLVKTLEAVENAEKEMRKLSVQYSRMWGQGRASRDDVKFTDYADGELIELAQNLRALLGQWERAALKRAQQNAHLTLLESADLQASFKPEHSATSQAVTAPTTAQVA